MQCEICKKQSDLRIARGCINNYCVEINLDSDYFKATNNKQYCKIINLTKNERYRAISIKIEDTKEVCLIVPMFYTAIDKCVVLTEKCIFFMFDRLLFLFDPITMEIVKQTENSSSGTMIAAYSYNEDFILHGEMEIYRVTKELEVKWEFRGRDIFVRYKGEELAFDMKEDRICLYDWQDNYYEINYDGKILLEKKAKEGEKRWKLNRLWKKF